MANFSELLSKPLDDVKRPPTLPAGTYHGFIKSYEPGESSEKKTPYVRFNFTVTSAGDDIDPRDLTGEDGRPIDLSKKQLRRDFYMTADAEYRLKEFLESMKIPTKGRTWASSLPETINQAVILDVIQRPNRDKPTDPPFAEVRDCRGA